MVSIYMCNCKWLYFLVACIYMYTHALTFVAAQSSDGEHCCYTEKLQWIPTDMVLLAWKNLLDYTFMVFKSTVKGFLWMFINVYELHIIALFKRRPPWKFSCENFWNLFLANLSILNNIVYRTNCGMLSWQVPYVGNIWRRKYWRIWRILGNSPNFYPPNVLVLQPK